MGQILTGPSGFSVATAPLPPHQTSTTILAGEHQFRGITIVDPSGERDISIPAEAYSLSGFRRWAVSENFPTRGRFTFSPEGLIIDMSPELLETHNYIKADIGLTIHSLILRRELGRFIGDRALFSNESANLSTEPDAMFISGDSVRSGRCTLVESSRPRANIEILGAPDWILEVVSPTSVRKDKVILREGYFRAGVGEYWIVDALGDQIEFDILVPGPKGYVAVEAKEGWLRSVTFGCSFQLAVRKDKDGFPHYLLNVQENS